MFLSMKHVGSQLPDQESNTQPLALEDEILTSGLPGKSLHRHFKLFEITVKSCSVQKRGLSKKEGTSFHMETIGSSHIRVRSCTKT